MSVSDIASLTPEQIARRCEDLGARVEHDRARWSIWPPDPTQPPVFLARKLAHGRTTRNVVTALRRSGLDITAEAPARENPPTQEKPPVSSTTPRPAIKPVPKPAPPPSAPTPAPKPSAPTPPAAAASATRAKPGPKPGVAAARAAEVKKLTERVDKTEEGHADLLTLISELESAHQKQLDAITARLADVETRLNATPGAPPPPDPDAHLDEQILELMRSAPITWSVELIAVNLQLDYGRTKARLEKLVASGHVDALPAGFYKISVTAQGSS